MQTGGDVPEVSVFATESPARIVLDLADTSNEAGTDATSVGVGSVQKYSAIEAGGRTRVMVDLSSAVTYDYRADPGLVVLTIAGDGQESSRAVASNYGTALNVEAVDFRRGENGQARVIVSMDQPGASVSVNESLNSISIDIYDAILPDNLDQQLDVMDFATPVQLIDSTQTNNAVRVKMATKGCL